MIPYCHEHDIAVTVYNALGRGILTGKFGPNPQFEEEDLRLSIVFFEPQVWPHVYETVEQLKPLAKEVGRPLAHLAIRWVARQPAITSIIIGARNPTQVQDNVAALAGDIPADVFDRMTEIGEQVISYLPDVSSIYRHER